MKTTEKEFYLKLINIFSISYFFSMSVLFLGYLIKLIGAKNLDPYDFGLVYSILTLFNFFLMLTDFGISEAIIYRYFKIKNEEKRRKLLSFCFSFKIILSILFLILFILFKNPIMNYFGMKEEKLFYLSAIFLLINGLLSYFGKVYELKIKPKILYFSSFLQFFLILTFAILFFKISEKSAFYFLFAYTIGYFSSLLIASFLFFKYFKKIKFYFSLKAIKENIPLFKLGFALFVSALTSQIMYYIDTIFIVSFFSPDLFSFYNIAFSLLLFPQYLFLSLVNFVYPLTSKYGDNEKFKKMMKNSLELLFFLVVPFSLAYFIFSKEIVFVLFGKEYLFSNIILKIFSVFLVFKIINGFFVPLLKGLRENLYIIKSFLCGIVLNIILNTLVIVFIEDNYLKLKLIAVSTSISWVVVNLLFLIKLKNYLFKKICVSCVKEKLIKLLIANLLFLNFILGLKEILLMVLNNYLIIFLIEFVIGVLIYLLITKLLGIWPKIIEDIYVLIKEEIRKKLKIF